MKHRADLGLSPKILCLYLVAGLTACSEGEGGRPAEGGSVPLALRVDLQAVLDGVVADGTTPGVVLHVAAGTGESWSAAAGQADVEQNVAMASGERFRAGSIAKSFVATAVLQAVEAGKLRLDDALTDHLPAAVTDRIEHADQIRISMLLGHRSGIPDWLTDHVRQTVVADPAHVWSLDEVLTLSGDQPAAFLPGERFGYSNTNYNLLGEILSAVYGRSWRDVVSDQVFAAAGLDGTSLPDPGNLECPAPCAHGYVSIDGASFDATRIDPTMAGASGGHALITTAANLTRFHQQLRSGALFARSNTLDAMLAYQPASDPEELPGVVGYGLGMFRLEHNGVVALGHMGGTAGYQSFMLYLPATDRYVSGSINVLGDFGAVLVPILDRASVP